MLTLKINKAYAYFTFGAFDVFEHVLGTNSGQIQYFPLLCFPPQTFERSEVL